MKTVSIFNDVIGPVMRGPSSSHTAGSYHLAALVRPLLGEPPSQAEFLFDPSGSYGQVYRQQGSDLAFTMGLLGWPITDPRFPRALELAPAHGLSVRFGQAVLPEADHPNTVRIVLHGRDGSRLEAVGRSIGGGAVELVVLDGWPVHMTGKNYDVTVEAASDAGGPAAPDAIRRMLQADASPNTEVVCDARPGERFYWVRRSTPLPESQRMALLSDPAVRRVRQGEPVFFVERGQPLFADAAEWAALASAPDRSLGDLAIAYEAQRLGLTAAAVVAEAIRRFVVMQESVRDGLRSDVPPMQLLRPTASRIYAALAAGQTAIGGIHARAAARAMAAMHVNCSMGVVCAAPTAGSAGVLPGVLVSLFEEKTADAQRIARALMAAGAVGLIVARRATFAAEVAGCQVEVGAAGAMAAAAVVDFVGGTAQQAADAAAIALQNTMGSVCDLVQGIVEIPCTTRNAAAAASAFVCADLVLGGYENPIPLDDTIDAVYAVGKMLPPELRVTSRGGLAIVPSACALARLR